MNYGILYSGNEKKILLNRVMKTSSRFEGTRGLLFRKPLKENEGLIIQKCSAIHTVGMKYSIDVIFLRNDFSIKKINLLRITSAITVCNRIQKLNDTTN